MLTFNSVNEIVWCDYSNETSLIILNTNEILVFFFFELF